MCKYHNTHGCARISVVVHSPLGIWPQVVWLCHMVVLFLIFGGTPTLIPIVTALVDTPDSSGCRHRFPHIFTSTVSSVLVLITILTRVRWSLKSLGLYLWFFFCTDCPGMLSSSNLRIDSYIKLGASSPCISPYTNRCSLSFLIWLLGILVCPV